MSSYTFEDPHGLLRTNRRLPSLKGELQLGRNTLYPVQSSPANLIQTPEPLSRKKLTGSASKQKRVASVNKKSPNEKENMTNTLTFVPRKAGMLPSPNVGVNTVRHGKIPESGKKQRITPPSNFDTFAERFQQLQLNNILPNYEPSRSSQKPYGIVKAFGVCTNQGLVRDYNEDRVSIVLDIPKPFSKPEHEKWPNCSIFAIFDGHGGSKCADFLRNNLHYYIARNKWFPSDPEEALKEACEAAEKKWIENQLTAEDGKHDTSGSCGLVMVIVDDNCYVCNIGDSRSVISRNGGKFKQAITRDHKPSDELEKMRVLNAGGRIYQNFPTVPTTKALGSTGPVYPVAAGPHRILPGGLAISRAFGDIEAKIPRFGGKANVLIANPEITTLKINKTIDFLVLGCDGIFDVMSNEEVCTSVWNTINKGETSDINELMRLASENLIREALLKKSFDNVTVIVVAFPALAQKLNPAELIDCHIENVEGLNLSPKPISPNDIEEGEEQSKAKLSPPKMSPPQNPRERFLRTQKLSPAKMLLTTFNRTLQRNPKKELTHTDKKDSGKKEIFPRISVTKAMAMQS